MVQKVHSMLMSNLYNSFLYVDQCDENTTFSNHALYLGLPCCKDDFNGCPNIPSSLIFQRSTKETIWISTQLSSTKLTQNGNLLTLHAIFNFSSVYQLLCLLHRVITLSCCFLKSIC